jgi:hypothetical protein
MNRTLGIVAAVLAVTIAAIVAYDRGRSDAAPTRTFSGSVAIRAQSSLDSVEASGATVLKLKTSGRGCTRNADTTARAICDVATALADIGLNGTITFVGTDRQR